MLNRCQNDKTVMVCVISAIIKTRMSEMKRQIGYGLINNRRVNIREKRIITNITYFIYNTNKYTTVCPFPVLLTFAANGILLISVLLVA